MKKQLLIGLVLLMSSGLALAHPNHGLTLGFISGFEHPFTGLDHLLVMLAIGVLATKQGNNIQWVFPLAFTSMLLLGAILGSKGFGFVGLESSIAATVIAMGLLLILPLQLNKAASVIAVALFGVLHGSAHGLELAMTNGLSVILGITLATSILHAVGLLFGQMRSQLTQTLQTLFAGTLVLTGTGMLMLT